MTKYPRRITINTSHASKPFPQWRAFFDEHPDMLGYGKTEADAVYELFCMLEEREQDAADAAEGARRMSSDDRILRLL